MWGTRLEEGSQPLQDPEIRGPDSTLKNPCSRLPGDLGIRAPGPQPQPLRDPGIRVPRPLLQRPGPEAPGLMLQVPRHWRRAAPCWTHLVTALHLVTPPPHWVGAGEGRWSSSSSLFPCLAGCILSGLSFPICKVRISTILPQRTSCAENLPPDAELDRSPQYLGALVSANSGRAPLTWPLAPKRLLEENPAPRGQRGPPVWLAPSPSCTVPPLLSSCHTCGFSGFGPLSLALRPPGAGSLRDVTPATAAPNPSATPLTISTTCLRCVDASGLLVHNLRGLGPT